MQYIITPCNLIIIFGGWGRGDWYSVVQLGSVTRMNIIQTLIGYLLSYHFLFTKGNLYE